MSGAARPLQPATYPLAGNAPSANVGTNRIIDNDSSSTANISSSSSNKATGGGGGGGDGGSGGGSGSGRGSAGSHRAPGKGKRTLIESACAECRRRKTKCDGTRPSCTRCANLRVDCYYEAEEGESRWAALRRRNEELATERSQLRTLLDLLRTAPEAEAQQLCTHIRTCGHDDYPALLRDIPLSLFHVSATPVLPSTTIPSSTIPLTNLTSMDQRLPPIHSILHDQVLPKPISLDHSHSLSSEDSRESGSVSGLPHLPPPDTLEPTLRRPMPLIGIGRSLSSEESVGSSSHSNTLPFPLDRNSSGPP